MLLPVTPLMAVALLGLNTPRIVFEGVSVTRYMKVWTDGYHNPHDEVYFAYHRTVTVGGREVTVEVKHGPAVDRHKNGRARWAGTHRHGVADGRTRMWAANGTQTNDLHLADGRLHGPYTQWAADSRKIRDETYAAGKLDGPATWYATDGSGPVAAGVYRAGEPWDGTFVEPTGAGSGFVLKTYKAGRHVKNERRVSDWWY